MTAKITKAQREALEAVARGEVMRKNCGSAAWRIFGAADAQGRSGKELVNFVRRSIAARSALLALHERGQWQPIETLSPITTPSQIIEVCNVEFGSRGIVAYGGRKRELATMLSAWTHWRVATPMPSATALNAPETRG